MSALAPELRNKLGLILAQQDADEEGVVLASALAAKRFLKAHNLHWRDVLPLLLTAPERHDTSAPHEDPLDWRLTVAECLRYRAELTPRDIDFLLGASRFPFLSEKQLRWLDGIASKLGIDGAAR